MYRSIVEMIFDTSAKDDINRSFVKGRFFFASNLFCRCVSFREQDARDHYFRDILFAPTIPHTTFITNL